MCPNSMGHPCPLLPFYPVLITGLIAVNKTHLFVWGAALGLPMCWGKFHLSLGHSSVPWSQFWSGGCRRAVCVWEQPVFPDRPLQWNVQLSAMSGKVTKRPFHPQAFTARRWRGSRESCRFTCNVELGWQSSMCFTSSNHGFKRTQMWLLQQSAEALPAARAPLVAAVRPAWRSAQAGCADLWGHPAGLGSSVPPTGLGKSGNDPLWQPGGSGWAVLKCWGCHEGVPSHVSAHHLYRLQTGWEENFLKFRVFNQRFEKKSQKLWKLL